MQGYRRSGLQGRASLNAIRQFIGLQRQSDRHGALEDAWLALMVYMWLHNRDILVHSFDKAARGGGAIKPSNFNYPAEQPPSSEVVIASQTLATGNYKQSEPRSDRAALLKAARPMAVLLLEIARSDEHLASEEIELLGDLIDWTCERLSLQVAPPDKQDVMAEIYDFQISQNILTRSARAIYEDDSLREIFPTWFARMATADGIVTAAERESIERVKAAFRRVM
jgi:hypothetical protein